MQATTEVRGGWGERRIAVGPWSTDLVTAGLLILRVAVLISVVADAPRFPSSAATRFYEIAHAPGVIYRDVTVEYPIGELVLIQAVGSWSLGIARALLALVAFGADLATFACVAAGWGREAARRYLLLGAPLLVFIYRRSDLVAVALVLGGIVASRRGREGRGGVLMGLGVLAKLWPAVVLPALVLRRHVRALRASAVTVAAGVVGWLALGGVEGIRQVVSLRGALGWELESTVGAVVWPLTGDYRYEHGANRTGSIPGWARAAMVLLLVLGLAAVWWRAAHTSLDPAGAPALVAVALLLVVSPVFSPQYVAWLVPWATIASLDARRLARLTVPPVALTGAILALWYLDVDIGRPVNQILMILRNLAVLLIPAAWFGEGLRQRRARAGTGP
jgi:glycosyl transferase family 87